MGRREDLLYAATALIGLLSDCKASRESAFIGYSDLTGGKAWGPPPKPEPLVSQTCLGPETDKVPLLHAQEDLPVLQGRAVS